MPSAGAGRALVLSTIGFFIAFSVRGLLPGPAPLLKEEYGLSARQVSIMVAIPVLLGSLGGRPGGQAAKSPRPRGPGLRAPPPVAARGRGGVSATDW